MLHPVGVIAGSNQDMTETNQLPNTSWHLKGLSTRHGAFQIYDAQVFYMYVWIFQIKMGSFEFWGVMSPKSACGPSLLTDM